MRLSFSSPNGGDTWLHTDLVFRLKFSDLDPLCFSVVFSSLCCCLCFCPSLHYKLYLVVLYYQICFCVAQADSSDSWQVCFVLTCFSFHFFFSPKYLSFLPFHCYPIPLLASKKQKNSNKRSQIQNHDLFYPC